jgi:hypothetical protein
MKIELLDGPSGYDIPIMVTRLLFGERDKRTPDKELLKKLAKQRDDYVKSLRGVVVWLKITAPRYWWMEYVTYTVGNIQLGSELTMYSFAHFSEEKSVEIKSQIPERFEQTRIFMVSYKTLRRILRQRKNHRLPEWRYFCEWIEANIIFI